MTPTHYGRIHAPHMTVRCTFDRHDRNTVT